jgi:hypothetical protein
MVRNGDGFMGYKIVHVTLSLSEFHLIHTLTGVPMLYVKYIGKSVYQESLTTEHGAELFANSLEEFLNRGRVTDESRRHFQSSGRNTAGSSKDIIGDPFND